MKKLISILALFVLLTFVPTPLAYAETDPDPGIPTDSSGNAYTQKAIDAANTASQSGVSAAVTNTSASNQSGFTALAPIPGLTDQANTSAVNDKSLANFFNNLYKYIIGMAAVLAIIMIIWSGLEIAINKDSVSKALEAKGRITQAIYGLVLVLAPVLVFSIINPSILNLSLNLPELKTGTPTPIAPIVQTGTSNTPQAVSAGCSVSLNQGAVGCPTQEAAQAFAASCSNGQGQVYLSTDAVANGITSTSYPYVASCNRLGTQQFGASQNYTDQKQIPKGLWCYTTNVPVKTSFFDSKLVTTFVCGASKDSCESLLLGNAVGGVVIKYCSLY